VISCLGGARPAPGSETWGCKSREHCANYLARGPHPVERLCGASEEPEYRQRCGVASLTTPQRLLAPLATITSVLGRSTGNSATQEATAHNVGAM